MRRGHPRSSAPKQLLYTPRHTPYYIYVKFNARLSQQCNKEPRRPMRYWALSSTISSQEYTSTIIQILVRLVEDISGGISFIDSMKTCFIYFMRRWTYIFFFRDVIRCWKNVVFFTLCFLLSSASHVLVTWKYVFLVYVCGAAIFLYPEAAR